MTQTKAATQTYDNLDDANKRIKYLEELNESIEISYQEHCKQMQTSISAAALRLYAAIPMSYTSAEGSLIAELRDILEILTGDEPTKHLAVCRAMAAISIAGGYEHFGVYGNLDTGEIHFPRGFSDEPTEGDAEGKERE